MTPNFAIIAATSLIPLVIAMIWFHPSLFGGDTWSKLADLSDEKAKEKGSPLKMLISVVLNFFLAFGLYSLMVHES